MPKKTNKNKPATKKTVAKVSRKKSQKKSGSSKAPLIVIISVVVVAILIGGGFLIFNIVQNNDNEAKEKEISDRINECITTTKKDMLGFITDCYEKEGRTAPTDVMEKDKERVDRILAQAEYDVCMCNAKFKYDALWDLNDNNPQNGDLKDTIRYYISDSIQKEYEQDVQECKTQYPLVGTYEKGFKTEYKKELIGWKEPKSDKTPIINRYNTDGLIVEGSNIPSDQDVPDSVGSVGGLAAKKFKNDHLDLWY